MIFRREDFLLLFGETIFYFSIFVYFTSHPHCTEHGAAHTCLICHELPSNSKITGRCQGVSRSKDSLVDKKDFTWNLV